MCSDILIQDISSFAKCICIEPTILTIYPPEKNGIQFVKPGTLIKVLELTSFLSSDKNKRICMLFDEKVNEFDDEELYLCSINCFESVAEEMWDVLIGMKQLCSRYIVFKNKSIYTNLYEGKNFELEFIDQYEQKFKRFGEITTIRKIPDLGPGYYLGFDVTVS